MAPRKKAVKRSGFQQALHTVLENAWPDPEVSQHAFFKRWAQRAGVDPLSDVAISDYCLKVQSPNRALSHIANIVAELDWPAARTRNALHRSVIEVVELMTLVLCEQGVQKEVKEKKFLGQSGQEKSDWLVVPMENRLAACMVAAAWLQLRMKLVLDESGYPAALNLLTDLPPQEFGWTDAKQAAKAEVMAYLNHVRGGEAYRSSLTRREQLEVVKRRKVISDEYLDEDLQDYVSKGGAMPTFGLQKGMPAGIDDGTRVWLRDALSIECFMFDPVAAKQAGSQFDELQGFLLKHLEEIIMRVHVGARSDSTQGEGKAAMSARTKVFISYSHADKKKWLPMFQKKLAVLQTEELLDLWDDTRIKPGDDWYAEIDQALKDCQIALLLISDEFLSSSFIQKKEMTDLLQKHKEGGLRLYPVLLRDCLWEVNPHLKRLQIKMTDGAKALETCKPAERNAVLTQIARDIHQAVKHDASGAV